MNELESLSREELMALAVEQRQTIAELAERIALLEAELERLRKGADGTNAPHFVKPSRKAKEKKPRRKRGKSYVRRREEPTERVDHMPPEQCPCCGEKLSGRWEKRRRQVIEIPVMRARVIEHVFYASRCRGCGKEVVAKASPEELGVVGKQRVGVRLMSAVSTLHLLGRVPIETIKMLLGWLYGLQISEGELIEIMHTVAEAGKRQEEELLDGVRGSPVVCADETGWREDGVNGYVWSASTPETRVYRYSKSRAGAVAVELLGEGHEGVVVSDFYSAYDRLMGMHQRCWAHLLREIEELIGKEEGVGCEEWARDVKTLYQEAKGWEPKYVEGVKQERERRKAREEFQRRLMEICRPYLGDKGAAQRRLCVRIARYLPELFTFVEDPRVPSSNNAAERAIRPVVTARKVSGGTRSAKGTQTKMTLATLFHTWVLRGIAPMEACRKLLLEYARASP